MIDEHEERLASKFLKFLKTRPKLRLFGPYDSCKSVRVPTFSFTVENKLSKKILRSLAKEGIAVSNGHFYAKRLVEAMGVKNSEDGVVRVSMAHYNTDEEVERLITAMDKIF